jgi:hypothetical protein
MKFDLLLASEVQKLQLNGKVSKSLKIIVYESYEAKVSGGSFNITGLRCDSISKEVPVLI